MLLTVCATSKKSNRFNKRRKKKGKGKKRKDYEEKTCLWGDSNPDLLRWRTKIKLI